MTAFSVSDPFTYKSQNDSFKSDMPLSGLKLAVKDLFHISGIPTTAGNPCWLNSHDIPTQTSTVVTQLMENGVRFCGKTITDELAFSLNGQNVHYPNLVNTITPERLPGGSSSGSAIAVSLGLADIGLGTDTGGSIRVPSSYNGLYGFRPTHGVISVDNLVELAPSFDTVGWMTKKMSVLADVADVLLNPNKDQIDTINPSRLCLADSLLPQISFAKQIKSWFNELENVSSVKTSKLGDRISAELLSSAGQVFSVLQGREIWSQHGQWVLSTQPTFAPDIKARLIWASELNKKDEAAAKEQQSHFVQIIESVLEDHDFIILPTTPGPAPLLRTSPSELAQYRNKLLGFTALAGLCGLPQLHLPIFDDRGMAVGVSLIGSRLSDLSLIETAKRIMETSQ